MQEYNRKLLEKMSYLMEVQKYSKNTINPYCSILKLFFDHVRKQSKDISLSDFENYLLHIHDIDKLSYSYHAQICGAWKMYLKLIHKKQFKYDYKFKPRKSINEIEVLTNDESWQIIESIHHVKQKTIISGIYLHGLRRSEILKLRYADIDRKRNLIVIRGAKGNKDRIVPLNKDWLVILAKYARQQRHAADYKEPIFYPYSPSSISSVLKAHALKVRITKRVYPHLLRDSFATCLLNQGVKIEEIQDILGHNKAETTRKYIHISAINIAEIQIKKPDYCRA